MKAAVVLAIIPLGIAATLLPEPRSPFTGPKIPPQAHADTFRERFEAVYPVHTFEQRWWPGEGVTFDERWAPVSRPGFRLIRTVPITKPPPEPIPEVGHEPPPAARGVVPHPKPRPTRVADICTQHGLRKVTTGRTWRCRKI